MQITLAEGRNTILLQMTRALNQYTQILRPNGGDAGWDRVNTATPNDNDATNSRIEVAAYGPGNLQMQQFVFTFTPYTGSGVITQIAVYTRVRYYTYDSSTPEARAIWGVIGSEGNIAMSVSGMQPSNYYITTNFVWPLNPITQQPWTLADMATFRAGCTLYIIPVSEYMAATRCNQLYAVVSYQA